MAVRKPYTITGKVGDKTLELTWDGQHLRGRIGGALGKEVSLSLESGFVQGRVGGLIGGFTVNGQLSGSAVE
ncbi:hypothetical protein OFC37_35640, partial [Escherichia coli]|nr:hypothetical protein [Escherichia coli]